MNLIKFCSGCVACLVSLFANAQTDVVMLEKIRALYPSTDVTDVSRSPVEGIWQIAMGKNIAFTDSTGRYLIFGALFDSATRQVLSMTAPVSDAKEANLVAFPEAHLADALKTVRGNGSRVFAVFSDPNCGYCKSLEKELTKLDNVTIYTFMVPFLSDDSLVKGNTVWCSSDRNKAWAAVIQGKPLRRVLACESPLERNRTLAQRLVVNGTPTLVSVDGRTHAGYSSAVEITQWLAAVQIKESSK